ncbi:MAG: hypothetical protein ACYCWE_03830 [Eubacteriales bacterium]
MYGNNRTSIFETFRNLWREHVIWTASYINSVITGFGYPAYENQRMFENIDNFENELIKYYGNDDTKNFGAFMKSHILLKIKFMLDYQNGYYDAAETDKVQWIESVNLWASLLSKMNPYWDLARWQEMLNDHVQLTEQEVIYELTYKVADINHMKITEAQAMEMADYMAEGIIQQFNL